MTYRSRVMQLTAVSVERMYLACGSIDLRKSIDGSAAIVIPSFELDPLSPALFVSCNCFRD